MFDIRHGFAGKGEARNRKFSLRHTLCFRHARSLRRALSRTAGKEANLHFSRAGLISTEGSPRPKTSAVHRTWLQYTRNLWKGLTWREHKLRVAIRWRRPTSDHPRIGSCFGSCCLAASAAEERKIENLRSSNIVGISNANSQILCNKCRTTIFVTTPLHAPLP